MPLLDLAIKSDKAIMNQADVRIFEKAVSNGAKVAHVAWKEEAPFAVTIRQVSTPKTQLTSLDQHNYGKLDFGIFKQRFANRAARFRGRLWRHCLTC